MHWFHPTYSMSHALWSSYLFFYSRYFHFPSYTHLLLLTDVQRSAAKTKKKEVYSPNLSFAGFLGNFNTLPHFEQIVI